MTNLEKHIGKTLDEMTAKDWQKVEDAIHNFSGKRANMEKIRNFQKTLKLAKKLKAAKRVFASYPAPEKMHASIYLDLPTFSRMEGDDLATYINMLKLCDELSMATNHPKDPECMVHGITRVTFSFYDVWETDFKKV